ncbi:amino acid permease [Francisellaceae bacterium]|nr:amino acid permease [Francisellaceae bacterium]
MTDGKTLKRSLKSRHLTMMALGGTIGTGLLLASGAAVHDAGPGSAILGYLLVGIIVYFLMTSLGEMAAHSPTTGSFCEYSAKYVDKAFGFAMSWNYWLNWVLVVASEVIAAGLVMQYWFPNVDVWLWTISFFILIFAINLFAVKLYGEAEYWLSFIKVSTVIIFIIVGTLMIFGLVGNQGDVGFKNITIGDAPFHAGWLGFFSVFLVAGYSFQGTELIGVAAGEAKDPHLTIPKAIKSIFWRIMLFYVLAIMIIGFLIPYTSQYLVNPNSNVTMSPFTIIFKNAGIEYAASLMNLVVITAIISAANASLFTASRVLWHMAKSKEAPAIAQKVRPNGVPIISIIITAIISGILVLISKLGSGAIFEWLLNIISLAGYIAWFGICLSHYRFRRAYIKLGSDTSKLHYKAPWFPFAPLCAMLVIAIIIVGQQVFMLFNGQATWAGFLTQYCGVILFFILFLGYKILFKTKLIPLSEINVKGLSRH